MIRCRPGPNVGPTVFDWDADSCAVSAESYTRGWRMYVHLEEEIYLNGLLQRRGPLASFPGGASSVGVCTPVS